MNFSRALLDLKPAFRQRLRAIAAIAGLSELEALELILVDTEGSIDSRLRRMEEEHRGEP